MVRSLDCVARGVWHRLAALFAHCLLRLFEARDLGYGATQFLLQGGSGCMITIKVSDSESERLCCYSALRYALFRMCYRYVALSESIDPCNSVIGLVGPPNGDNPNPAGGHQVTLLRSCTQVHDSPHQGRPHGSGLLQAAVHLRQPLCGRG